MKSTRRTLLKTAGAAGLMIPWLPVIKPRAQGINAFYFDGFTKYYQWGPTPDTVQADIDPGLPNVVSSSNQLINDWFTMDPIVGMNVHTSGGIANPNQYGVVIESQYPDAPWINGIWVVFFNDPDPFNDHYILGVFASSDSSCTNWISAQTSSGCIPPDGSPHNIQIYLDTLIGTVDYLLDSVLGVPANGLPDMVVETFTGPFLQQIQGMSWQVGATTYWTPDGTPDPREWQTTYSGMMDELMVYSGNYKMTNTPVNNQLFYQSSGQLLRATTFSLGGQEIASEFPTVYLRGFPPLDANAAWFVNANPPPVLPWIVLPVPDDDNPGTAALLPAADPYP